jgi:hypothetical protein
MPVAGNSCLGPPAQDTTNLYYTWLLESSHGGRRYRVDLNASSQQRTIKKFKYIKTRGNWGVKFRDLGRPFTCTTNCWKLCAERK